MFLGSKVFLGEGEGSAVYIHICIYIYIIYRGCICGCPLIKAAGLIGNKAFFIDCRIVVKTLSNKVRVPLIGIMACKSLTRLLLHFVPKTFA